MFDFVSSPVSLANSVLDAAQTGAVFVTPAKALLKLVTDSTAAYGAVLAVMACERGCRRDLKFGEDR
jgi:hypothetical protein